MSRLPFRRSLRLAAVVPLFAVAVVACGSSDDSSNGGSSTTDSGVDDSVLASRDASKATTDAALPTPSDAGFAFDAASLPPAVQMCATCMKNVCEPQITACEDDEYCSEILSCTLESGCLLEPDGGVSTCISSCPTSLGLTSRELLEATKLIEAMATSCTSCLTSECPKPTDGG